MKVKYVTPHGAKVSLKVILQWINTNHFFCADSYFATIVTAELLHTSGLKFIRVALMSTKNYPISYLGTV